MAPAHGYRCKWDAVTPTPGLAYTDFAVHPCLEPCVCCGCIDTQDRAYLEYKIATHDTLPDHPTSFLVRPCCQQPCVYFG